MAADKKILFLDDMLLHMCSTWWPAWWPTWGSTKKLFLADMELDMVTDKEVDKVANMVAGYGNWLIGPKLFRPEAYPACTFSNLCEFIFHL